MAAATLVGAACGRSPDSKSTVVTSASGGEPAASDAAAASSTAKPACAPDNGGITLPAGFCATIFDDSAGGARHITVAPNGDVFVNRQTRRGGGGVLALRDANGDGVADTHETFGSGTGTGIGITPGWIYVEETTKICRRGSSSRAASRR